MPANPEQGKNGLSERRQNGSNNIQRNQFGSWSGQQDLNLRPGVPKTPALPGCAIPRRSRHWIPFSTACSKARTTPAAARVGTRPARPRSVAFAEHRARHAVAHPDAEFARRAGDHLQHRPHRSAGGTKASDIGLVFSATCKIRPSPGMKIMSSEM